MRWVLFFRLQTCLNSNCSEPWIVNFFFKISGPIARRGVVRLLLDKTGPVVVLQANEAKLFLNIGHGISICSSSRTARAGVMDATASYRLAGSSMF